MTNPVRRFRFTSRSSLLILVLALSSACSGEKGDPGSDARSTLLRTTSVAPGDDCASGGDKVDTGRDLDGDGRLDDGEVDFTMFVCDGADGESAEATLLPAGLTCPEGGVMLTAGGGVPTYVCNGTPGAPGVDGQSVTATLEPAGAHCAHGGQRLQVGQGTPTYVCNGAPGATGQDGQSVTMTPAPAGSFCAEGGQKLQVGTGAATYVCNGAPGATGQDGQSVTMVPEPAGAHCEFGGVKLQVGSGPEAYLCTGALPGATRPIVETVNVAESRYSEAVVNASVTDGGSELILARGVVVATHAAPSLQDEVWFSGAGSGSFSVRCDGLAPSTTYYVRAFATNALGTSYGSALSFTTKALTVPTLATQAVSNVTNTTAISGGSITDDGGTAILARGICWSPSPDPTLAAECATEGAGTGSFIAMMTGLGANSTYHVRAYATNAQGTSYGEDRPFTTVVLQLPSVTTTAPSGVSFTTATSGGDVKQDNGAPVSSRGICWATTPGPTTADSTYTEAGGLGSFTATITGLAASTTYYVRAFAVNGGGTSYGNEVSFTTLARSVPTLTTKSVGGVSSYIAGSGGTIATDGGSPITAKGVCWSLNPAPTIANSRTTDGSGAASYNSTITGLNPLTTYYVRAYATNALGTAYGNEISFTTTNLVTPGPTVPVVGTSTSTITGSSTASSGGYVSSDGGSDVVARGVCWSTSPDPTLADSCSTDGGGVGFFTSTATGLSGCGVVYYVRAYATNATGTGYGNQNTVSTGLLPSVTTSAVTATGYYDAAAGGAITDDGGCPITQKGLVWSWNPDPTTSNPSTAAGTGTAPFAGTMTGLYANRTYYLRAYATNSVGTAYGQQEVFATAEPSTPYIGKHHAGGIVFHVDGTGEHGLVAALSDQGRYPWGCEGVSISTGVALGTGATNTAAIVASCGEAPIAAKVADDLVLNGYDDWFLPSRDELSSMYTNLYYGGLGGLGSRYWTSSQSDAVQSDLAWDWGISPMPKRVDSPVRAVRAF
jgi:hypothetical protein